jgi:hypothetical protein
MSSLAYPCRTPWCAHTLQDISFLYSHVAPDSVTRCDGMPDTAKRERSVAPKKRTSQGSKTHMGVRSLEKKLHVSTAASVHG